MKKMNWNQNWLYCKMGEEKQKINLPHDAMLTEERDANLTEGSTSGYFPGGTYIYEKDLPPELNNEQILMLEFEGIYRNSKVYLNDQEIGGWNYGYTGFYVDLSDKISSARNTVRIVANNAQTPNARWYTGSGIYRNVNLYVAGKQYFVPDGTKITTLSTNPTKIVVKVSAIKEKNTVIKAEVLRVGKTIATADGEVFEVNVSDADLWTAETPNLYELRLKLIDDGVILDEEKITFGIRKIECDSDFGLQINGQSIKLRGGCIHHDNGILGACSYKEADYRKIKKLKDFGYNAVRFSHYPAGKDFLAACDELGLYVLDEAFDVWKLPKNAFDYSLDFEKDWRFDIDAMVRKDYNHPSVIMYSVGNEITDTGFPFGGDICANLCGKIREQDTSRPITIGLNILISMLARKTKEIQENKEKYFGSADFNNMTTIKQKLEEVAASLDGNKLSEILGQVFDSVDIIGLNYGERYYDTLHKKNPKWVFLSTETFPQKIGKNWRMIEKLPYVVGDFMWTAWDYLGESGVGLPVYGKKESDFVKPYPSLTAACGSFDITGFPESQAYYTAAVWNNFSDPFIGVRPVHHSGEDFTIGEWRFSDAINSWSWKSCEGRNAQIEVYGIGESIELFQDGNLLGRKKLQENKCCFETIYREGNLHAIAYDVDGNKIGESKLKSAVGPLQLSVKAEKETIQSGEIVFINLEITDRLGNISTLTDRKINVRVNGGKLLAFGSANPVTEENYLSSSHTSYHGRITAVVQGCMKGILEVFFSANGIESKKTEVKVI